MPCARTNDPTVTRLDFSADSLLLYLHVPFCRSRCNYCSFHSGPWSEDAAVVYLDAVCRELRAWGERLGRPRVTTVYMGGGTPSMLPAAAFVRLRETLERWYDLGELSEWTVEGNPESAASEPFFRDLLRAGVNRFSLGVQSFDDRELALLGRLHSPARAVRSFDLARSAGFENIGLDLIWGVPGQTVAGWLDNLATAVDLGPEHMSCYGLSVDPGTRLARAVQAEEVALPEDEVQEEMFLRGAAFLEQNGYFQYEISNFCLPGRKSVHNGGYWTGRPYLGIGPAAVSCLNEKRWRNPEDLAVYARTAEQVPATEDVEILSRRDLVNESVMLSLRTARGLDAAVYRALAGRDFEQGREGILREFEGRNILRRTGAGWSLTGTGMLVSNEVLAELLE